MVGAVFVLLVMLTFLYFSIMKIFYRPRFYKMPTIRGVVIDKETGKPVPYAGINECWEPYGMYKGERYGEFEPIFAKTVSDRDGRFNLVGGDVVVPHGKVPTPSSAIFQITWPLAVKVRGISSKVIYSWFPGYKRKEIKIAGDQDFPEKLTLELEKPETPEEAIKALKYTESRRTAYDDYMDAYLNESLRIIRTYPRTEFADEAFYPSPLNFEQFTWYFKKINCQNLIKREQRCLSDKKYWLEKQQ